MDDRAVVGLACAVAAACWVLACAAIVVARLVARRRRNVASIAASDITDPDWAHVDGPHDPALETREHLERGLRSSEPEVRRATVAALGRLGRRHAWAIDGLVEALAERRDVPARVAAELDQLAPRADTRLAPLLEHPSSVVRYYAARLLARDGDVADVRAPDLSDDPSPHVRAAALERLGKLDILHNNVGASIALGDAPATELTEEAFQRSFDVNLKGTWLACKHALPALRESGGSIVNIASMAALNAYPLVGYKTMKAAVVALTENLAAANARHGIRANAILPGWIETAMTEKALNWDKFREKVLPRVPVRRWGRPEDFGAIAVYLVSDASGYHTGDTFLIDGGYSLF